MKTSTHNEASTASIGELCTLVNGRAFKPTEWGSAGLPIIRIQNLNDEDREFNYYDGPYDKKHEVNTGDLLFSWSGTPGTSFGAFFWNRPKGVLNQHIFNVHVDKSRVNQRYFRYAMNHRLDHIIGQAHGGVGLKHITKSKLEAVEVPLPPLSEQKRIADILDKADAIRRKRQEAVSAIDDLVRSSFYDIFGDPLRNPRKWPVERLGRVAILDRGRSRHRPRDAAFLYGGPYPFVQTGDITNSNGFVRNFSQTYSEEGLAQSKMWPAGTLCITIAANIAKTAILTFDACFPDSVVGLLPSKHLTTEYVRYWFVAMEKAIDAAATQVAQKNINLQILRDLNIQVPPLQLQEQFTEAVKALRMLRDKSRKALDDTDNLFSSLVQRTFKSML